MSSYIYIYIYIAKYLILYVIWYFIKMSKIVSEYDQEIPKRQTADNPMALRGRATQPPRDTRKTN